MDLDRLEAVLRPRSAFEATDLGFAMGVRWARPILLSWLALVLPVYAIVWAALWSHPVAALVVAWWLKPVWDQVPLHVVSRALFGHVPTVRETLRALPRLVLHQAPLLLVVYRLDPARSFLLPVLQLERPAGYERGRRRRALSRSVGVPASWLTGTCLALELVLVAGLVGLVAVFAPAGPSVDVAVLAGQWWEGTAPVWLRLAVPAVAFTALTVVEPLYVAAGFALYVNRRTELEGWDVELVFRRMADRLRGGARGAAVLVLLAAAAFAGAALAQIGPPPSAPELGPSPGAAAPTESRLEVEAATRRVLARPELQRSGERRTLRWRRAGLERPPDQPSWLRGFGARAAVLLEVALWLLAGVALALVAFAVVRRMRRGGAPRAARHRSSLPTARSGLSVPPPEPLPADVPATVLALWDHGLKARALGVLYRGTLAELVETRRIEVVPGATEGECVRLVRAGADPATAAFFAAVAAAWQSIAYAHLEPDPEGVRRLCAEWRTHFAGGVS